MKIRFFLLFLLFSAVLYAQTLHCSVCRKKIRGQYLSSGEQTFCSQKCFERTLPPCSVCGKKITGQFLILGEKKICSKECLQSIQPKCGCCHAPLEGKYHYVLINGKKKDFCTKCNAFPRCFVCNFPTGDNALSDGRHLCRNCSGNTVCSREEAQMIADRIRRELNTILPKKCSCSIQIRLLDRQSFDRAAAKTNIRRPANSTLLGFFHWQEHYLSNGDGRKYEHRQKEYICILSHIPRDRFMEVAAHELAHHWQHHLFPGIADDTVKEGFAEYAASRINIRHGNAHLNERMRTNPDPVYGGGYRMMCKLSEQGSWNRILQCLSRSQK